MSVRQLYLSTLLAALCAACAHTQSAGRSVILAGSVCSGVQPLTAAASSTPGASESAAAPGTTHEALVAYVTDAPASKLVVYDIRAGRVRFEVDAPLSSRPQLLRDVVVAVVGAASERPELVAYDLQTGQPRWQHQLPRPEWLGAVQVGAQGQQLVTTTTTHSFRPQERGSTLTALDAHSGALLWERDVPYTLSAPSADAERVLVISDHADVWALDADSGKSVGCSHVDSGPVEWLSPHGSVLLVGTDDARAWKLGDGAPEEVDRLQLPIAELPGQPLLQPPAYQSVPAGRSAHGRVTVAAALEASGPAGAQISLRAGHYYYAFYRHLFAYDTAGQLRWVRALDADAVRLRALADALVVVTEAGELQWLRAQDGAVMARVHLPISMSRSISRSMAAALTSADLTDTRVVAGAGAEASAPVLRQELRKLAIDTDARLLPSRRLAVTALAALPDPEATRDLLDIYRERAAPVELRRHVARVLGTRKVGSEYLVEALDGDYNFLTGEPAPPLAAIVPGLVTNGEARAVPRLIDRLFDPDTRLSELKLLVEAIAALAGPEAQKPLSEFFALYHADSALRDDASSLLSAAQVLWTSGAAAAVEAVAKDPSTLDAVTSGLVPLMATAEPSEPAAPTEQPQPEPQPERVIPRRLSESAIANTFAQHAPALRECVAQELARNAGARALRFSLVIEGSGEVSRFSVWPKRDELMQCLQPKISAMRFPAFAQRRRLTHYTLSLRPAEANEEATPSEQESTKPFWFVAQLRAVGRPALAELAPWWRDQNPLFVSVEEPSKPTQAKRPDSATDSGMETASHGPEAATGTAADSGKPKPETGSEPKAKAPAATDQWWLPTSSP